VDAFQLGEAEAMKATLWAAVSTVVALFWTVAGHGYPFYGDDELSLLNNVPARVGAPLLAVVCLTTMVLAFAMSGRYAERSKWLAWLAWPIVAALLFVIPDEEVFAVAGYAPMLIIGAPFGWPPIDYATVFTPALFTQVWSLLGGFLLARVVIAWQFPAGLEKPWMTRDSARRWGRWAAYVAAIIPVLYAITRLSWLAGIPLGIPRSFLHELQDSGAVWAGGGLGTFAIVGAVLTLGLVQRWGEVFPRWMVGLSGKSVPVKLATVPATLVSILIMTASVSILGSGSKLVSMIGEGSLAVLPMVLWPLWSVALGAATLAYYLRRR
jgi:hypothetical protein